MSARSGGILLIVDGAFLTGQMLIAMPGIGDPRFERSLILICAHDADHAMGLAVNRPAGDLSIAGLLARLEIKASPHLDDEPVLLGGPVEMERGFVLHTGDFQGEHSLNIPGDLTLTTTRQALEALSEPDQRPRRAILALGYAGWGAGQLEREIRQNVWLTVDADEDLVFDSDHSGKWTRALGKLGVDPRFLTHEGGRA